MPALTEAKLRSLKPRDKLYRLADGRGLCVEVQPSGARYWRYRYRYAGSAKMLSLGVYPDVSLAAAREACDAMRAVLKAGQDPSTYRRNERVAAMSAAANTFEGVAREWLSKQTTFSPATRTKALSHFETWLFPVLGKRPVDQIEAPELLAVLRRPEHMGKLETTQRLKQRCGQIFRYAIATGRAKRDPAADLRGALATVKTRHHAAITDPAGIGALLVAIDGYAGTLETATALRIAPYVFLRPGELRGALWAEIDLDGAEWRIPAERMKMRRPHIVPLARQCVALLRELQPLTATRSVFVFPALGNVRRPLSENTLNAALRRLGYSNEQMTAHGFRSMASTRLHEMGWDSHVVERQLAHVERNQVKAAYNHAEYLSQRRKMMQAWADYLDQLRDQAGGKRRGLG